MAKVADMTDVAALMGETVEAMAAGQAMALALLKAEMAALAQVMPGAASAEETETEAEARRSEEEARVEAGFDNMPV